MKVSFDNFKINGFSYIKPFQNNLGFNTCLKPLERDTVSFSGRKSLIAQDMKLAPSLQSCQRVNKYAEPARYYLERILGEYVGPFVDSTDTLSTKQYPVLVCRARIKSPVSIREKVVSKYSAVSSDMAKDFARKVYNELARYYKPNPNCDVEKVLEDVKSRIEGHDSQGNFLPYTNPALFYYIALQSLQHANAFNFSSIDDEAQATIDKDVLDELKFYLDQHGQLPSTETHAGIKLYASDIVGARIVLREADTKYTKAVFNAIKAAVLDGKLKITTIENNVPDPEKLPKGQKLSDYVYATDATLNSLKKASGADLITNKSKSGYTAVHINVDFSDCDFAKRDPRYSGFKGEIQIIGREVEDLKEIEDLCYKLKDNKNAIKAEYKPFKQHFERYYVGDRKQAFDDYTYSLYLEQRALTKKRRGQDFPSIEQLGFADILPEELDFNYLAKIKKDCDTLIKMNEAKAIIDEIQATLSGKKRNKS